MAIFMTSKDANIGKIAVCMSATYGMGEKGENARIRKIVLTNFVDFYTPLEQRYLNFALTVENSMMVTINPNVAVTARQSQRKM